MNAVTLDVAYRPIKVGFCVRHGDFEGFERALRLSHELWGGRFNPLIPVDDPALAESLVEFFRPDVLHPLQDDVATRQFVDKYPYLSLGLGFAADHPPDPRNPAPCPLNLYRPGFLLRHTSFKALHSVNPDRYPVLLEWQANDPLRWLLLATFGALGSKSEEVLRGLFDEWSVINWLASDGLQVEWHDRVTVNSITAVGLDTYSIRDPFDSAGIYLGSATSFPDLVNYWNLRAADVDVVFLDWQHKDRLLSWVTEHFNRALRQAQRGQGPKFVVCWSGTRLDLEQEPLNNLPFAAQLAPVELSPISWNGSNVKPISIHSRSHRIISPIAEAGDRPTVSYNLPEPPFHLPEDLWGQQLVHTVSTIEVQLDREPTFSAPYLPEINAGFQDELMCYGADGLRVEPECLGFIVDADREVLSFSAIPQETLIALMLQGYGVESQTSQAGRIAMTLIQQMGGMYPCAAFRSPGLRNLIEKYSATGSFTRGEARQQIVTNPRTGAIGMSGYEHLSIPASGKSLSPDDVFVYLMEHGLFSVGLELECPTCKLKGWRPIDRLSLRVVCEFCSASFHVGKQLRDRPWAYRRSGLFGRDNNQEGAIPALLTLRRLVDLGHSPKLLGAATNLRKKGATGWCETDFVFCKTTKGRPQVVLGECKTRHSVEKADFDNLMHIAALLPKSRFDVFLLMSKLHPFTDDEITLARRARIRGGRIILLSDRELEPLFPEERVKDLFEGVPHVSRLEDLETMTNAVYLDPKPKTSEPA